MTEPMTRVPQSEAPRDAETAPAVTKGDETTVLALVARLALELEKAGIRYCHWKSNEALDRSLAGINDLDLLIARADLDRFRATLGGLGFKDVRGHRAKEVPGVFQMYGLDVPSGRLVNVHAHAYLVLGDDTTKNWRLPIEDAYLDSSSNDTVLPLPSPDFEYVVFVTRMILKHATWDGIAMLQGDLAASEKRELAWLEARIDGARVRGIIEQHLPALTGIWDDLVRAVRPGASVARKVRAAAALTEALSAHARRSPARDTPRRIVRRVWWATRRFVLKRRFRKQFAGGGALIAIVGGDGAGKSSAVEGLSEWLGGTFETRRVHLGKPPPSLTTLALKGPMAIGRKAGLFDSTRVQPYELDDAGGYPGNLWLLWGLLTARDRHREYRRARRLAMRGAIVICDRFPMRQIRLMDGARSRALDEQAAAKMDGLGRALARMETRYYDRILPPDLLVVLRVDPDVAVARKPEEVPRFVRARSEEIYALDWGSTPAVVIDGTRDRLTVLTEIKSLVWARL